MHANVERYTAILYSSILKMLPEKALAEQVLQTTVSKLQSNLNLYDARKMRFLTWALNVARNECVSLGLMNKHSLLIWKKETGEASMPPPTLTQKEKVLIELVYVRGFTVAEVAEMLKATETEINVALQKITPTVLQESIVV